MKPVLTFKSRQQSRQQMMSVQMNACPGYLLRCWLPANSLSLPAGPRLAAVEDVLDLVLAERPGAVRAVAARPVEPLLDLHGVAGVRDELRLQRRLRALARLVRACGGRERLSSHSLHDCLARWDTAAHVCLQATGNMVLQCQSVS